jgi:hypothetical protein
VTNTTQPRPFDEHAALDELERLAERIQASRRQRELAVAEFDAFVKTFRDDQYATRLRAVEAAEASMQPRDESPALPAPPPATAPKRQSTIDNDASEPVFHSERAMHTEASNETLPPGTPVVPAAMPERESAPPIARMSSVAKPRADLFSAPYARWILVAAGVLLLVLAIAWLRSGSSGPARGTNPAAPAQATQPSAPAAAASHARPDATVPTPVASSGPARALNVQLVTLRPVWARVTVDDKKVIEREIPGGQTIPLGADRSISIRAGDAGAMRLIVDGKDQGTVGRGGQPATRTLTANR